MPFPNEHALRLRNPDDFADGSFRRTKGSGEGRVQGVKIPSSMSVIWGKIKGKDKSSDPPIAQALRFPKGSYSAAEAKSFISKNKIKGTFEAASDKKEDCWARRFDNIPSIGKGQITPQGFLKAAATITRTGIFTYRNADGSTRRELRIPEEVFDQKTLDSFKNLPLTDDHPEADVTIDNVSGLMKGMTSERVDRHFDEEIKEDLLETDVIITDKETIRKAQDGKQEVSCGYEVFLDFTPGEYKGERYDAVQRKIKGNHLAIVDSGRAGHKARLHLDSLDAILIENPNSKDNDMKKIKIDGVEFEVSEALFAAHEAHQKKIDENIKNLEKEKEDEKKKCDSLEKEKADLVKERDGMKKKLDSAAPNEEVQAKLDAKDDQIKKLTDENEKFKKDEADRSLAQTISLAKKVFPADFKFDGLSEAEVKREAVSHNVDTDISAKSDEYINVRFDVLLENASDIGAEINKNRDTGGENDAKKKKDAAEKEISEAWKTKPENQ